MRTDLTGGFRTAEEKRSHIRNHVVEFGSVSLGCAMMGLLVSGYYYKPKIDSREDRTKLRFAVYD